jgi:drug/metabolite transporter (DMT)-like permease
MRRSNTYVSELGIIFAVASALTANVAILCKHRGATMVPTIRFTRPLQSAINLFRSKWWLIGFAVAAVAWGLHVIAMALAPLSMVQVVTAGGLALLALPAQKLFGIRLGRREWAGLLLSALGLAWLALTAEATDNHSAYSFAALLAFEGALVALGATLLHRGSQGHDHVRNGVMFGVAAGILIGVGNVSTKALTGGVADEGLLALASPWSIVTVGAGVLAFFALARGLQIGPPIQVIALSSIAANVAAIAGGILVFGDSIGTDALGILARGAAFAAVIAAAVLIPAPRTSERTPAIA